MDNITSLNFANIIAPVAGGQAAAGVGGTGPLSGSLLGGSGLLGGGGTQAAPVDLFTLLLGQGQTPQTGENFAATGKNLPQAPVSKENFDTTDKAIDALQAVLTGLVVQQQAVPAPVVVQQPTEAAVPTDSVQAIVGSESTDILLGGATAQLLNTTANAATDTLQPQVKAETILQPTVSPVVTNKTLDAYRSAANLTLPVAGANLNTIDQQAIEAVSALPQFPAPKTDALPKSNDAAVSLLQSAESSPDTLVQSIERLKNLSAMTPLPAEKGKPVGTAEAGNAPLDQLAKLQSALTPVKNETVAPKVDVTANADGVAKGEATITSSAVAQTTGQKMEQNLTQKKPGEGIAAVGDKALQADGAAQQVNNPNINLAAQPVDHSKPVIAHDFNSHLSRAAVASPSEQIAMQLAKLPSGKQNITVQLDPADLGKVDVKLEWSPEGKTHITISAERRETLEMLKGDAGALQRSLSDSGIKADAGSLQFSLKGQESFAGQMAGGSRDQQGHSGTQAAMNDNEIKDVVDKAAIAARYVNLNNLLDLKV